MYKKHILCVRGYRAMTLYACNIIILLCVYMLYGLAIGGYIYSVYKR